MKTKIAHRRHRSARPLRGSMTDCSTLKNPHARPRAVRRTPKETTLCQVIDRTAERIEPRMVVLSSLPFLWDNMARWSILYACRYRSGYRDMQLHEYETIAATRAGAIESLQKRLVGFAVAAVEIFEVRPPLTRDQVAEIQTANEELDQERQRLGIYGEGEQRENAIKAWLFHEE